SRAAWLPRLSLSALLGTLSASPENLLFMSGQAYSVGGSVLQPLIDFGRIKAQIRASDARAQAQLANLQQHALTALSEVETALSAYFNAENRRRDLVDTEAKAAETLRLSRKLFLDGLGPFLNVLDAQRGLLRAQLARTGADAEVVRAIVDLQSAMGGSTYADKPLPDANDPPLFQLSPPEKSHSALDGSPLAGDRKPPPPSPLSLRACAVCPEARLFNATTKGTRPC
ncbi:MAG: TolC family protein, partial [Desulfovibrionaceae bacterium]|nr:TolC family protein [Desulfovibrionaceae bacterium]